MSVSSAADAAPPQADPREQRMAEEDVDFEEDEDEVYHFDVKHNDAQDDGDEEGPSQEGRFACLLVNDHVNVMLASWS